MQQYSVTLNGATPLIMHRDNLAFSEQIKAWQNEPENKALSVSGDDRSPAWTWIGGVYHDGRTVGIDADNIMTMLREGGVKVKTGNGKETFKKQTQSGIMVDQQQFELTFSGGKTCRIDQIKPLIGNTDFAEHLNTVEKIGFELSVKRAKIGRAKHVRVRAMFREWQAHGSITILDPEVSGLSQSAVEAILRQAGALCGLCDWRPSSPQSPGMFGKFVAEVRKM